MFRKSKRRRKSRRQSNRGHRGYSRRLSAFEPLEQRLVLATQFINVTTTADTLNPSDGVTSLREAVIQANAISPADDVVINLQANAAYNIQRDTNQFNSGFFVSTENGSLDPEFGDFDVSRSMTINGHGAFVRGESLGRVFQVTGGNVTFNDMVILNGGGLFINRGAGMHVSGGSQVELNGVRFVNNVTFASGDSRGGALYVDNAGGTVAISGSWFDHNIAQGSPSGIAFGGAIYVASGRLEVFGTEFDGNLALGGNATEPAAAGGDADGGAVYVASGDAVFEVTTFTDNRAVGGDGAASSNPQFGQGGTGGRARGGAIFYFGGGVLDVSSTQFVDNDAEGGAGSGVGGEGGDGGSAIGGALFLGPLKHTVSIADSDFRANWALAGGVLGEADDIGGRGGDAKGGAIATAEMPFNADDRFTSSLIVTRSAFDENKADGGDGGRVDDGFGGQGGTARGGAIYAAYGSVDLVDNAFRTNRAMAGDGGFVGVGRAGDGGNGAGGAVFSTAWATLSISGDIEIEGPLDDPEKLIATSLMYGNTAFGGSGGWKSSAAYSTSEDEGGRGGDAFGGAVAATAGAVGFDGGPLTVSGTLLQSNSAQAGNGGRGFQPAAPEVEGGPGGASGTARGGALYSVVPTTTLSDTAFTRNAAVGGRLDQSASASGTAGGASGRDDNGAGQRGGAGGGAYGGGTYVGGNSLTVTTSGFTMNQAVGGMGGAGGSSEELQQGGAGGGGGNAAGGGLRAETIGTVIVHDSAFLANYAQGGRGGSGGKGGFGPGDDDDTLDDMVGGDGGRGGNAEGGGISIVDPLGFFFEESRASVDLARVLVRGNMAIGGDGGFAGQGGLGAETGGAGGDGGDGGQALGGGVHLQFTYTTLADSTVENNVVSSGFGAQGGYGGAGVWRGGDGGNGGSGALAAGGGVASIAGSPTLFRSTIVQNHVASGFGGNGGFAALGEIGGGSGGNGGRGGDARGGGLYTQDADFSPAVGISTIALNTVDAGGGGFGSPAGRAVDDANGSMPVRYQGAPGGLVFEGAARVLDPRFDGAAGDAAINFMFDTTSADDFGVDTIDGGTLDLAAGLSFFAGSTLAAATIPAAATVGIIAGIGTSTVGGSVAVLESAGTAGVTVMTFSGGTALLTFGAFSSAALGVYIGASVLTNAIVVGTQTGDWEAAFAYALGDPGVLYPRNLATLLTAGPGEDDDPPDGVLNSPGSDGARGSAEGTGIWGESDLRRTIVSDNEAFERSRTRQLGPVRKNDGTILLGNYAAYNLTELATAVSRADVAGGSATSDGTNFIGAVNSGFVNDLKGTTANPLSANPDTQTRFNGGPLPTLKLLPGSPARQAISIPFSSFSQNGFLWQEVADIGAWGGPANRAPLAANGPFTTNEDAALTVPLGSDPDDDLLQLVGDAPVAQNGTVEVVDGQLNYTPNADWFGQETLTYQATDGELTATVTTVIDVLPVNDRPAVEAALLTINEDEVTFVDLWDYVTDIDTPKELLQFVVINGGGTGVAELQSDGHTVKFTPRANFFNSVQPFRPVQLFEFSVTDPGDGAGPPHEVNFEGFIGFIVLPVNDAPINVLPASPSVDEDSQVTFNGPTITDVDAAAGENQLRVRLSVEHGTLSLGQIADLAFDEGDGTDDQAVSFTGDLDTVNAALADLTYRPLLNFNGTDQLKIVSDDLGNFGAGGPLIDTSLLDIIVNAVNDAPVIAALGSQTGYEDVKLVFTDVAIADVDTHEGTGIVQVALSVQHGTLTLSQTTGLTFTDGVGKRDAAVTFTGTVGSVNAALLGMYYLGDLNYSGADALTLEVNDLGNTGSGGPLTDSATVGISLISWQQQTEMLIEQVNMLHSQGVFNSGQANGLLAKLNLKNSPGDLDKIRGFLDSVESLRSEGVLSEEQATSLRTAATILLTSVSNVEQDPLAGDFNDDGHVNGRDFLQWQRQFGSTIAPFTGADGSGNGLVGAEDLALWQSTYGNSAPLEAVAAAFGVDSAESEPGLAQAVMTPAVVEESFTRLGDEAESTLGRLTFLSGLYADKPSRLLPPRHAKGGVRSMTETPAERVYASLPDRVQWNSTEDRFRTQSWRPAPRWKLTAGELSNHVETELDDRATVTDEFDAALSSLYS